MSQNKCSELAKRGRIYTDKVLRSVLNVVEIEWMDWTDPKSIECHLDKNMGIDGIVHTTSGISFTFQTKCRDVEIYNTYGDWTLEHMSNKYGAKGEFFHLAADLYIYGWENEERSDFVDVYVFYVAPVKRAIAIGSLRHVKEKLNDEHGTATFRCYNWTDFNPLWIWFHKLGTV